MGRYIFVAREGNFRAENVGGKNCRDVCRMPKWDTKQTGGQEVPLARENLDGEKYQWFVEYMLEDTRQTMPAVTVSLVMATTATCP
jgi:hypothetical protein